MSDGKIFGITGVSSGIGAATAATLMAQGAQVVGFDRNVPSTDLLEFHQCDASNPSSIESAISQLGVKLDGFCNIAGLPPTRDKASVLKVNFFGLRHFTEHIVEHLHDGSPIVNLASLAGFAWRDNIPLLKEAMTVSFDGADEWIAKQDVDGAPSYHLSKELVIAWTILNHNRWRSRGIRVNSVSPGPVATPILADFIETLGKRAEEDLKVNRAATPQEIANVVAFMCSESASWINGADIACDGGAGATIQQGLFA
jgi:NAD(P)-dependent dehydrogenase (short-subunit alcohol dehydrogenase family)